MSSHSRRSRRFRDLAALVDLADEESDFTATTSMVQRMEIKDNNNAFNATSPYSTFVDKLKSNWQEYPIQEQDPIEEEEDEEEPSFPKPHLSEFLLRQQNKLFPESQNNPYYANSNAGINGDFCSRSQAPSNVFSSADLSMEAEANQWWGGSTAQRFRRVEKRGSLTDRLRSRFNSQPKTELKKPKVVLEPKNNSFSREILQTSTDSTDSCTLSTSTPTSMSMSQHSSHCLPKTSAISSQSPSKGSIFQRMNHDFDNELSSPSRNSFNNSFRLQQSRYIQPPDSPFDEPEESEVTLGVSISSHMHDEVEVALPSPSKKISETPTSPTTPESPLALPVEDEANIPAWKRKQRQKMRERMGLLETPSLLDERTSSREESSSDESSFIQESPTARFESTALSRTLDSATPSTVTPESAAMLKSPSLEEPVPLSRSRSWRIKQFRRSFRHRTVQRNPEEEVDASFEEPVLMENRNVVPTISEDEEDEPLEVDASFEEPVLMENRNVVPTISEDEEDEPFDEDSSETHQQVVPLSPVKRLRDVFETPSNRISRDNDKEVVDPPTQAITEETPDENDAPAEPNERNQSSVVAYPTGFDSSRLIRKATAVQGDNDNGITEVVSPVAHAPSHDAGDNEKEKTEEILDSESVISATSTKLSEPSLKPPAAWWNEMTERIDRYHSIIVAKSETANDSSRSSSKHELLQQTFESFAEDQNQLGRAMAVALFRGMELANSEPSDMEARHARELQELQAKHEEEMQELRQQLVAKNNAMLNAGRTPISNTADRNEAFRERFKKRMSINQISRNDAATEVASTVISTMSCRELSVERYRAKILQQMNKGRSRAPSVAPSVSNPLSLYNEDKASDVSTTASETSEKKNAQEIQRLLDELQQAERRQKLLEKQLQQAGVVLAEDIPYQLAKDKVAAISKRMNEIGSSDVTHDDPLIQKQLREEYFRLEKDMQKYLSALLLTDEFAEEQRLKEEAWESKHAVANTKALAAIRKHMPIDIRTLGPQELEIDKGLPKAMVQKFRRTNVLQLLRVDPSVVAKWHPSTLEAFRVTGLTLTERRALHCYLLPIAAIWNGKANATATGSTDAMTTRKLAWYKTMRSNFQEALTRYENHLGGTNGTPRRHIASSCLANRCNLVGNQCPIRANKAMDYFATDLGFPEGDVYESAKTVAKSDSQNAKSAAEVIAEARLQPRDSHVYNSPIRKPKAITLLSPPKATPHKPTNRPKHPMMSALNQGPAKPSGLLAAIAARRID